MRSAPRDQSRVVTFAVVWPTATGTGYGQAGDIPYYWESFGTGGYRFRFDARYTPTAAIGQTKGGVGFITTSTLSPGLVELNVANPANTAGLNIAGNALTTGDLDTLDKLELDADNAEQYDADYQTAWARYQADNETPEDQRVQNA